jgi:uncharacterized protein
MKSLQEIESILSFHKQDLLNEYPIKTMAIFGSIARQENNAKSDLDILIEFNGKIGIRFVDLAEEIEKLTGYKVDLVSKNGIKGKYLKAIDSELIYV